MSNTGRYTEEVTEHTALMDGHIAEAHPDRKAAIARKRKSKSETQRTYGVSKIIMFIPTYTLTSVYYCYRH